MRPTLVPETTPAGVDDVTPPSLSVIELDSRRRVITVVSTGKCYEAKLDSLRDRSAWPKFLEWGRSLLSLGDPVIMDIQTFVLDTQTSKLVVPVQGKLLATYVPAMQIKFLDLDC